MHETGSSRSEISSQAEAASSCPRPPGLSPDDITAVTSASLENWFSQMVPRCKAYAIAQKQAGHPIVGLLCEYAPRELILAAGGVPVCLCGGDPDTIPAAESVLPANLCPLIKSTFGYHVERTNPFLEMADLLVAETTCDGKKKMFELMGKERPTLLLELPQKENDPDAFDHWVRELRGFRTALASRFGVDITDAKIRAASHLMNRERRLRRSLAELMKANHPPFTGRQLLDFKSLISTLPSDLSQYEKALEYYRAQPPPLPSGRPPVRILLTGVPLVHGAERVLELIESHGGCVVCMENCTGLKPILDEVDETADDPLLALATKYYALPCSVKTPNQSRLSLIRRLAAEYQAQCVIELVWHACHTYNVEAVHVKRLAENELRLPYLKIETDYAPSDSARIAVRLEALFETVRSVGCIE